MTLLSFMERFAPPIESRAKKHTIRANCRIKVGDRIQLWTGAYRPGQRRKLSDVDPVCTKIEEIVINAAHGGRRIVMLGGALLEPDQIEALARADGFATTAQFYDYFCPHSPRTGRPKFIGHIIHWDWL